MNGVYLVVDIWGREISESNSFSAARTAVHVHLICDGEEPPLHIFAPDGKKIASADLDCCGHVLIRSNSTSDRYERRIVEKWGLPITGGKR